jgi:excisionase family DNA binding protein
MSTVARESAYLSVRDAARMLDVAPITIRRRIADGSLPSIQPGGYGHALRVPRVALDAEAPVDLSATTNPKENP